MHLLPINAFVLAPMEQTGAVDTGLIAFWFMNVHLPLWPTVKCCYDQSSEAVDHLSSNKNYISALMTAHGKLRLASYLA